MRGTRRDSPGSIRSHDDDLLEWDYGVYEGLATEEIRTAIPGWSVWTHDVVGGESVDQVGARADRVIERAMRADGDVALVAHAHFLRVLAARWIGLPPAQGRHLTLDTGSMSVLGWERDTKVIRNWNVRQASDVEREVADTGDDIVTHGDDRLTSVRSR